MRQPLWPQMRHAVGRQMRLGVGRPGRPTPIISLSDRRGAREIPMPRPIPVPLRHAVARYAADGYDARTIADLLGLAPRTVRRFLQRLRRGGPAALTPAYPPSPPTAATPLAQAALEMRRQHPTWGAPLIRVLLAHDFPPDTLPGTRTLQRWFRDHGLAPAPKGRRPPADYHRATRPHAVWQ